ncbi:MAG: hypothetical protein R3F38_04880 [Gammaproteobacteria bacterium]
MVIKWRSVKKPDNGTLTENDSDTMATTDWHILGPGAIGSRLPGTSMTRTCG